MAFGRTSDTEFLAERLGDSIPVVVFSVDREEVIDERTNFRDLFINFQIQEPGSQPNLRETCARYNTKDKRIVAFSRDKRGNWSRFDPEKEDYAPIGVPFLREALDRALRTYMEKTAESSRALTAEVLRRAAAGSRGGR